MARTRIHPEDAPDLASEITAHDHDADYEAAGGIGTHEEAGDPHAGYATDGDLTTHAGTAHGLSSHAIDGAFHSGTSVLPSAGQKNALAGTAGTPGTGNEYVTEQDPRLSDDRDPTAHAHLDADIPAGIARDSEVTSAVSDHAAAANPHPTYLTQAEGDAAYEVTGATATHAGLADPHTGYRLESADHSHASTGLQAGTIAHTALTSVGIDDHHARDHAVNGAVHTGTLDDAQIPAGITRDAEAAAAYAAIGHTHSGASTAYAPDSFTVATGNFALMVKRLELTTTQRATLAGTSRLRIT